MTADDPSTSVIEPLLEQLADLPLSEDQWHQLDTALRGSASARRAYLYYIDLHVNLQRLLRAHAQEAAPDLWSTVQNHLDLDPVESVPVLEEINPGDTVIGLEVPRMPQVPDELADDHDVPLEQQAGSAEQTRSSSPDPEPALRRPPRRVTKMLFRWAAVLLVGTSLAAAWLLWRSSDQLPAVLVASSNSRWSGAAVSIRDGQHLPRGPLELTAGTAQLLVDKKVIVTLQAPARFEVISPTQVSLTRGLLAVDVPHEIKGFTVRVPGADVVDLGTEFGVSVDKSGVSEVHVLAGRVSVTGDARRSGGQVVAAGSACRIDSSGHTAPAPLDVHRFEFAARPDGSSPYDRWLANGQELRRDPAMVAYYTFETDSARPTAVLNTAPSHQASDGMIGKAQWTSGRFPGKTAVYLSGVGDSIPINVQGKFHNLTLWTWVRTEGDADTSVNSSVVSLLETDGFAHPGHIHWNLRANGLIELGVRKAVNQDSRLTANWVTMDSAIDWPSGGWAFLACVVDDGAVSFYRDGVLAAPTRGPKNNVQLGDVLIGPAQIGKLVDPSSSRDALDNFHGSFDEFGILSRAMSAAEIERLYEAGRP